MWVAMSAGGDMDRRIDFSGFSNVIILKLVTNLLALTYSGLRLERERILYKSGIML